MAIGLAFVCSVILNKTKFGLRLRSVGEHPQAADTLGINVYHIRFAGVLISGFLAGIGGAIVAQSITLNFSATTIAGQGFIAMAAMIFGKWNSSERDAISITLRTRSKFRGYRKLYTSY